MSRKELPRGYVLLAIRVTLTSTVVGVLAGLPVFAFGAIPGGIGGFIGGIGWSCIMVWKVKDGVQNLFGEANFWGAVIGTAATVVLYASMLAWMFLNPQYGGQDWQSLWGIEAIIGLAAGPLVGLFFGAWFGDSLDAMLWKEGQRRSDAKRLVAKSYGRLSSRVIALSTLFGAVGAWIPFGGMISGACFGFLAGVVWVRVMHRRVLAGSKVNPAGTLWGGLLGLLTALFGHTAAYLVDWALSGWAFRGGLSELLPSLIVFGLPFGLMFGLLLGAICERSLEARLRYSGVVSQGPDGEGDQCHPQDEST